MSVISVHSAAVELTLITEGSVIKKSFLATGNSPLLTSFIIGVWMSGFISSTYIM